MREAQFWAERDRDRQPNPFARPGPRQGKDANRGALAITGSVLTSGTFGTLALAPAHSIRMVHRN